MQLIIAEKPIAAKRIADLLGENKQVDKNKVPCYELSDSIVVPLKGHVLNVDFPKEYNNWQNTELEKLIDAELVYEPTHNAIVKTVSDYAKKADSLVIATDYDRDGESIGNEAVNIAKNVNNSIQVKRAKFSALTKQEIDDAFSKLSEFDHNLADSADARREIDLIWGAALSRYISITSGRLGKNFLSVGRVQTQTLAMCNEREKEIKNFKPEPYSEVILGCEKNSKPFTAIYKEEKLFDKQKAQELMKLKADTAIVKEIKEATITNHAPTPFNTTEFLRAASNIGILPSRALSIAESLYMQGYMSYPRTDNTHYPESLDLTGILDKIATIKQFQYLVEKIKKENPKLVATKGKKKATDHPPIHPVEAAKQEKLDPADCKIYELVVRRFLSTFAKYAETKTTKVTLDYANEEFIARGKETAKLGWREFYPYSKIEEVKLPGLEKGDVIKASGLEKTEKETKPKPRYTPANLIKIMDDEGLGTKCLSEDAKIIILGANGEELRGIGDVFNFSQDILVDSGLELALNAGVRCKSKKGDKIEPADFAFISRRPLQDSEQMLRVVFSDGTCLSSTKDHPFCIYDGGNILYKELSQLGQGSKVVSSIKMPLISTEKIALEIGDIKLEDKVYVSGCISNRVKDLREKQKLSQHAFAAMHGMDQSSVSNLENGYGKMNVVTAKRLGIDFSEVTDLNGRFVLKDIFPMYYDSRLVRILAQLKGDGSLDEEKLRKENCYDVRYHNTDLNLLNQFVQDVCDLFGINLKIINLGRKHPHHKTRYYIKVPALLGRLLYKITDKGILNEIPPSLYVYYIGGMFDDEGWAGISESKLFISNTDHGLLRDLQIMLATLGIKSSIDLKQHKLHVRSRKDLMRFLRQVPFIKVAKKQRLSTVLNEKYNYSKNKSVNMVLKQVLSFISLKGEATAREIADELKISRVTSIKKINELLSEGLISKKVYGNNKDVQRVIKYAFNENNGNIYSLIGETIIAPDLATKTINYIEEIGYDGPVFDLTVSPLNPNFVAANGVVVHNSTRAGIIQKLMERGYIEGKQNYTVSNVGSSLTDTLPEYAGEL